MWTLHFICLQSACNISYENSSLNVSITMLFLHGGLKMNNCFIWKSPFKMWDAEMCVASLHYKKQN